MSDRRSLAGLCLLAALTIAGAVVGWSDRRLAFERLRSIESTLSSRSRAMLTSKWMSGGVERSYTTSAATTESVEEHARRHVIELEVVQRLLPVDP